MLNWAGGGGGGAESKEDQTQNMWTQAAKAKQLYI